jgi:AraC-like DNA-binding protein
MNELRVNETARQLREGETHIIDVVFDVGLNSVKAFNRIFSKFLNESRYNYRATHRAVG